MQTRVESKKEIIRHAFDALRERDYERFRTYHTEDAVLHEVDEDVRGIDAIIEHERGFIEAFPDLDYSIKKIIQEDDWAVVRHVGTGTHEGDLRGIAPTGITVEIPVMIMFRFEGDKVAEIWIQADRMGLFSQLGIIDGTGG